MKPLLTDGWVDEQKEGRMDGEMDGWTKHISVQNCINQLILLDTCSIFLIIDGWMDG